MLLNQFSELFHPKELGGLIRRNLTNAQVSPEEKSWKFRNAPYTTKVLTLIH